MGLLGDTEENRHIKRKIPLIIFFGLVACFSFLIMGPVNSLVSDIVGSRVQNVFFAPVIEEALKPFGLFLLVVISYGEGGFGFLKNIEVNYIIGYLVGGFVGILENFFIYGFFSGLRSATPLLHAFQTGLLGFGVYFVFVEGRKGLWKLVLTYLIAVSIHVVWNGLAIDGYNQVSLAIIAISVTIIGLLLFSIFFYKIQMKDIRTD